MSPPVPMRAGTIRQAELDAALGDVGLSTWRYLVAARQFVVSPPSSRRQGLADAGCLPWDAAWRGVHPDDLARAQAGLLECAAGGPPHDVTYRVRDADGRDGWVRSVGRLWPADEATGEPACVFGVIVDLTAQHAAQRHVQESDERMRLALAGASMGVWQHDRSTDRISLDALAAAHYDIDAAQVPLAEVLARIHPEDRPVLQRGMAAARDPDVKVPVALEYRVVTRDGGIRWLAVSGRVHFERVDGVERWVRGIGTSRDITTRRAALESLRESEERFRVLADAMPQIVWATRPDGYHDYFNERWYEHTGMPRPGEPGGEFDPDGSGQGWNWKDYLHPDDCAQTLAAWQRCLATGEPYHVEYRFRRRDGAFRWFIGRALPLRDPAGRIVRWFGTLTDVHDQTVTARQRDLLIERLREADRHKTEFLAMLAHELRNPLAPMRNAFALLDREPLSDGAQRALDMGKRQLRHLTRLVDDLLEISRVTRGMIELRPETVMVQQIVYTVVEAIAPSLEERRQQIRFRLPERPARLHVDPVRLAQILENLLTNASKYSDPGTEIHVSVRADDGAVEIEVRDEGIGIAPEDVPKLFTLFSQVDTAIDRSRGGLGIGLALVKQLVALHGGSVRADSAGLGRGATFCVRLPRVPGPQPDGLAALHPAGD